MCFGVENHSPSSNGRITRRNGVQREADGMTTKPNYTLRELRLARAVAGSELEAEESPHLQDAEGSAAEGLRGDELTKGSDERVKVRCLHIGNQRVIFLALTEERVRTLLGGVDL